VLESNVIVTWTAPNDNGSPITSYRITLQQADLTYSENIAYCDGSVPAIVNSLSCSVPLS
jgi:hypothetical protein